MLKYLAHYFKQAPAQPTITDDRERETTSRWWRRSMFVSITLGYALYYTCRLSLSIVKKPLIELKLLNALELGKIGSFHKIAYAIGKTSHGFLADRLHLGRLFISGLAGSAIANLAFGSTSGYWIFVLIWLLNGWAQSVGAPTSGVVIANWFGHEMRGTCYSVWSVAHNLGEGISFVLTARLVANMDWRAGFWGPGIICFIAAIILTRTMTDRPRALGLSHDTQESLAASNPHHPSPTVGQSQRDVLTNPWVWTLGLSSALMYVARYAINDWGVFYLQMEKGYALERASDVVALFPIVGALGTVSAGWFSDRFFAGRRTPVTLCYGMMLIASQYLMFYTDASDFTIKIAMAASGFAIGGLLVFLGGLTAMDICSKESAGAALGIVGGFSYLGAAVQDWVSGALIEAGKHTALDQVAYDFSQVKLFWLLASVGSIVLAALLWNAEQRKAEIEL